MGNECTATDDIVVTVNPLPTINLGDDTISICNGSDYDLDLGSGHQAYYWKTKVNNIYNCIEKLEKVKPGMEVLIEVERSGKKIALKPLF